MARIVRVALIELLALALLAVRHRKALFWTLGR